MNGSIRIRGLAIGLVALVLTLAGSAPASADATGGWMGFPVGAKIYVNGDGTHVDYIKVREKWRATYNGGKYGHSQVFNTETGTIWNSPDHGISSVVYYREWDVTGEEGYYPDGSKMCARWWEKTSTGYHAHPSSCIDIQR